MFQTSRSWSHAICSSFSKKNKKNEFPRFDDAFAMACDVTCFIREILKRHSVSICLSSYRMALGVSNAWMECGKWSQSFETVESLVKTFYTPSAAERKWVFLSNPLEPNTSHLKISIFWLHKTYFYEGFFSGALHNIAVNIRCIHESIMREKKNINEWKKTQILCNKKRQSFLPNGAMTRQWSVREKDRLPRLHAFLSFYSCTTKRKARFDVSAKALRPHLWWSFFFSNFFFFDLGLKWFSSFIDGCLLLCPQLHNRFTFRQMGDEVPSCVANAQPTRQSKFLGFLVCFLNIIAQSTFCEIILRSVYPAEWRKEITTESFESNPMKIRRRQIVNCFTSISHISPPRESRAARGVSVCKSHMVDAIAFMLFAFFLLLRLVHMPMWNFEWT